MIIGETIKYGFNWTEFRKWINGTYGKYPYTWKEDSDTYTILTLDKDLPRFVSIAKSAISPGADQLDFEANWKKFSLSPKLQLNSEGTVVSVDDSNSAGAGNPSTSIQLTDGVNGPVAVLPANGNAGIADKALVVYISPNQEPIPTSVVPATSTPGYTVGRISGLTVGSFSPVRQTIYVEQTLNGRRSILSTSSSDGSGQIGARSVKITYFDQTCAGPFYETISLTSGAAVNTVNTNICFIEKIEVISVGSNGSNVGSINLYTGLNGTGTIFAAIGVGALGSGIGDNQTFYAHHYIATGMQLTGYSISSGIIAAAGGGSSVTVLRSKNPTVSTSPFTVISDFINTAQGNSLSRQYSSTITLVGPAIIVAFVNPANNNSTATCSFDWSEGEPPAV